MDWQVMKTFVVALSLALPSIAQTCPRTRAEERKIDPTIQYGPSVACSGVSYSIPGFSISTATGCPLFVRIRPDAYSVSVRAQEETETKLDQFQETIVMTFRCTPHYIIFIPISSTCDLENLTKVPGPHLLQTVACGSSQ